ncbi:hypothetical protein V6N13_009784 [Hibiscus sabdariffa]|uniref:Uncharacterized protein n=1 Tax=Hibiscus sabdariffa TaxID=183260 RepID=A0ABR2BB78_9ROSI
MAVVVEVLPVDAAATPLNGGASILSVKSRRLLQVPANPWQRGCSRLTRCRGITSSSKSSKYYAKRSKLQAQPAILEA